MIKAIALVLLLGVAGAAAQRDLVSVITGNPQLKELLTAVSGDATILGALGSFKGTVLAPNNVAFKKAVEAATKAGVKLDKDTLAKILSYHVIPGEPITSSSLTDGAVVTTLEGSPITVKFVDGKPTFEGIGSTANVVRADIKAKDVVIHMIDTVLLPMALGAAPEEKPIEPEVLPPVYESVVDAAISNNLTFLVEAVTAAGLADAFGPEFEGTVFAPTDAAFEDLFAKVGDVTADTSADALEALKAILNYHVLPNVTLSSDLKDGDELVTANGEVLTVMIDMDTAYLETASGQQVKISAADIKAGNGVVHVIDAVLLPEEASAPAPAPAPSSGATSTLAGAAALVGSLLAAVLLA